MRLISCPVITSWNALREVANLDHRSQPGSAGRGRLARSAEGAGVGVAVLDPASRRCLGRSVRTSQRRARTSPMNAWTGQRSTATGPTSRDHRRGRREPEQRGRRAWRRERRSSARRCSTRTAAAGERRRPGPRLGRRVPGAVQTGSSTLSLGGGATQTYRNYPFCQAVGARKRKGIIVVTAGGNTARPQREDPFTGDVPNLETPPIAITVGALNTKGTPWRSDDAVASYSSGVRPVRSPD